MLFIAVKRQMKQKMADIAVAMVYASLVHLAHHAIPVLMGPHTFNFKDICARLTQADGLITVNDVDALIKEITSLLTDEDYRNFYGRHAVEVLYQNQGALQLLLQLLEPYLPPKAQ